MALHQQDENANQIWLYFRHFIGVVEAISPVKPKEMKGIEWDAYNRFKEMESDHLRPEARVVRPSRRIARCGAGSVTGGKVIFEYNPQLEEFK